MGPAIHYAKAWPPAPRVALNGDRERRLLAADVLFQMVNQAFLLGHYVLDQVANRQQTDQLAVFQYRQVPQVFLDHQLHAKARAIFWGDGQQIARHHLADRGHVGGQLLARHPAHVVAFGDNAGHLTVFYDHQGTDVGVGHQGDGLQHRGFWIDADNADVGLGLEDFGNSFHATTPSFLFFIAEVYD